MFAHAQYPPLNPIKHIVVIVQENRTPDNLFQGLCALGAGCGPRSNQYNIQSSYVDATHKRHLLQPVGLASPFDLDHSYSGPNLDNNVSGFNFEYANRGVASSPGVPVPTLCAPDVFGCAVPGNSQFMYVYNSPVTNTDGSKGGLLDPYLTLATRYGWANRMFQTNQGPSYPAHQFLFGGTSAPSAADDAIATFASENVSPEVSGTVAGCIAVATTTVELIDTTGENQSIYPCFDHQTMADLFDGINVSWKYYTPSAGSIWTAPDAISHICVPSKPTGGVCTGSDWTKDVILKPPQVLTDISSCNLSQVTWVIPGGQNSDHPNGNKGGGPSWVASIVNAVGNNPKCKDNEIYWDNTAIIITWDDWGGWYDH